MNRAVRPIWLIHGVRETEAPIHSDAIMYKEIGGNIRF